jgi:tryptophan synthase beta chain
VAEATKRARRMSSDQLMIVNVSGRGDKDMPTVAAALGLPEGT